jgi:hypothetical protein
LKHELVFHALPTPDLRPRIILHRCQL